MELTIDTSSNIASIALSHKGELISGLTWQSTYNHTVELTPNLAYLLKQAKLEPRFIEAIIVAKGPGSFNGLRVGISAAKGIALSLNIPLLGVSTLEAEAYPFIYSELPVCPILKVSRQEIASALYQRENNDWHRMEKEHLTTLQTLCTQISQETLFCGEISNDMASEIRQNLGKLAIMPQNVARLPRTVSLAALGWQRLGQGERDNLATLQPLYLKPPQITKPKERRKIDTKTKS
jgi:tRNA threonylcarbamoyl adenosine modification protein YeaZ